MIFTEPIFFLFLAFTFSTYWFLRKHRELQLFLLLGASAVFYGWWDARFLALITFVILVSWVTALFAKTRPAGEKTRRLVLTLGIAVCLAVLGIFKYFDFFAESSHAMLSALGFNPGWTAVNILLPVGISFYVFQAISYIVDTARGDLAAEPRISRVALYIAFFPQLVAGPIVRAASFFPQMDRTPKFSRALLASGFKAFLLGFIYKAGLADNLAPFVDPVYNDDLSNWSNSALIGATIAFAAQIYFDFAGYSLMAIGVARWFGFFIPKNFEYPYASSDLADFWRRWHISLSSWLRDYLYIPLGGNRGSNLMTYRNLMATMVLGGLWHGAAWTFVAWGAMHGAGLAVHRYLFGRAGRWIGVAASLIVTQLFVLLTWVPFRADSFDDAMNVWFAFTGLRESGPNMLPAAVWFIPLLLALDAALGRKRLVNLKKTAFGNPLAYWGGLGVLVGLLLAFYPLDAQPFVYFQF